MSSTIIFINILLPILYSCTFGIYAFDFWKGEKRFTNSKRVFLFLTLLLHLVYLFSRTVFFNHPPITNVDGLTNTKQYPWKNWALNFIQILSEIAKSHPELLLLVVSVRNGNTDAYQQIHRVDPARIDFKGPYARRDRQRLLLHRLFENRLQIPPPSIESLAEAHISERSEEHT